MPHHQLARGPARAQQQTPLGIIKISEEALDLTRAACRLVADADLARRIAQQQLAARDAGPAVPPV
jgi:hypothetical protein